MLMSVSSARAGSPNRRRRVAGRTDADQQLWRQLTEANERIAAHLEEVEPAAPVPAMVAQDLHLIVATLQDLVHVGALSGTLRSYVAGHAPGGRPDNLGTELERLKERVRSLEALTTPPPHNWVEAVARPVVAMSVAAMVGAAAAGVPAMVLSGGDVMKIAEAAISGVAGALAAVLTPSRITTASTRPGDISRAPTASTRPTKRAPSTSWFK